MAKTIERLQSEPFEARFLSCGQAPNRWVIDLSENDNVLIRPENYYTIPSTEDLLFINPEHVELFVDKGW